ncbi:hypothetical protein GQ457_01G035680 [Hibiscus cannabinus]
MCFVSFSTKVERDLRRATTCMSGMDEPIAFPICGCEFPAQLIISWSNDNPGRRFFCCKNYDSLVYRSCRFFSWYDPLITPRSRVIIIGLLKRLKADEVQRRKESLDNSVVWLDEKQALE